MESKEYNVDIFMPGPKMTYKEFRFMIQGKYGMLHKEFDGVINKEFSEIIQYKSQMNLKTLSEKQFDVKDESVANKSFYTIFIHFTRRPLCP